MSDLEAILAGEPDAVAALYDLDQARWTTLVEHVFSSRAEAAPAALVDAMLRHEPDVEAWLQTARDALGEMRSTWFSTVGGAMRTLQPWLTRGVRAARPASDPAVLQLRLAEAQRSTGDDALAEVRELVADLRATSGVAPAWLHDALLLLARRAHEDGAIEEGLAAAREAATLAPDDEARSIATRSVGALLLVARRIDEAMELLRPAMAKRGPLFGGGGSFRLASHDDPLDHALDEAATIASWAAWTTPEWVRALGAIAERAPSAANEARFEEALAQMNEGARRPVENLEAVIRHASERGLVRTADAAAKQLVTRFGHDREALGIAGAHFAAHGRWRDAWQVAERTASLSDDGETKAYDLVGAAELACRAGDLDDAERLLAQVPEEIDIARVVRLGVAIARGQHGAIERGLEMLESLGPDDVAESRAGHALVDLLTRELIARRDPRALDAQRALLEAKRALWGESPATWLEEHNLATVHAELGQIELARTGIERALQKLERHFGAGHPHVELVRRSLVRLDR